MTISLARSLAMVPEQWTDAPRTPFVDETARTRELPCVAPPLRLLPPGRYRSLTAMSAGFEIERLLTG